MADPAQRPPRIHGTIAGGELLSFLQVLLHCLGRFLVKELLLTDFS